MSLQTNDFTDALIMCPNQLEDAGGVPPFIERVLIPWSFSMPAMAATAFDMSCGDSIARETRNKKGNSGRAGNSGTDT